MFTRVWSVLVALALMAMVIGCAEAPEEAMKASDAAIQTAQTAEAEQYAPETYGEAMDSLNAAKAEVKAQDSKFSLFRDYDRAEALLAASQRLAQQAQTDAAAAKERVRVEDSTLISNIEVLLADTKTALASAPKGKGTKADIEMITADLTAAETAFADAKATFQAGKYLQAKTKLEAAQTRIGGIMQEIEAAKAKASGKR